MPAKRIKQKKNAYVCSCGKNVTKTQRSVGCTLCGSFFHIKCVGFTDDQHAVFHKNKVVFSYVCNQCRYDNDGDNLADPPVSEPKQPPAPDDLSQSMRNLTLELEKQFKEHSRTFEQKVYASIAALDTKMVQLFDKFRKEQKEATENLKAELAHNENFMKQMDTSLSKRILSLETQNNILQRRLNRSNIVIKGLSRNIRDLRGMFVKIAACCSISLTNMDIQHITYFSSGKAVLVKLNSVQARDEIMVNFSKIKYLLRKDIEGGDSESRILLCDHFTPAAANLVAISVKLREKRCILNYKFINADMPKVMVMLPNNVRKTLNINDCLDMFNESLRGADVERGTFSSGSNNRTVGAHYADESCVPV